MGTCSMGPHEPKVIEVLERFDLSFRVWVWLGDVPIPRGPIKTTPAQVRDTREG